MPIHHIWYGWSTTCLPNWLCFTSPWANQRLLYQRQTAASVPTSLDSYWPAVGVGQSRPFAKFFFGPWLVGEIVGETVVQMHNHPPCTSTECRILRIDRKFIPIYSLIKWRLHKILCRLGIIPSLLPISSPLSRKSMISSMGDQRDLHHPQYPNLRITFI